MRRGYVVWCLTCTWRDDTNRKGGLVSLMRIHERDNTGHLTDCMAVGDTTEAAA